MKQRIDDAQIDRLANEPWYVSSRASQKDRFARCLRLLAADGFSPQQILDVGCANGQFSSLLTSIGQTVLGIDINNERILDNQRRFADCDRLRFEQADFLQRPFAAGSLDCITALEVLYYFTPEQQRQFFQKAYECLRPGGRLLVSVNIFFSGHFSEASFLSTVDPRFRQLQADRIYRNYYYRLELPVIEWLDQLNYLEKLRIFSPNILKLERKFYPGIWNELLLRPSGVMDRYLLPGLRRLLLGLIESDPLYRLVTGLTRLVAPESGKSQLIVLLEKAKCEGTW